jgi:prepilin-type N-terminal cleavage/methylation domain-containing protein
MVKRHQNSRKGFSLAEAMMAMVILGMAAAGVLLPFSAGASVRAEGVHRTTGALLASDLMEKIVKTSFNDIVTNFGSYSEAQGQVKDANWQVFTDPSYAKFSRSATCVYVYVPQETTSDSPKFILATVEVSYGDKTVAVINRLISK